ncbi:MAG: glutamine synthetase [Candidatus Omnitrophota bacterium]|jgi:glutamine synthetase|nr:MAG: glutamine synthetase [Candidatus Omnitrophota bacterium]
MNEPLTIESLRERIADRTIDTVLVAFPDQFGRLIGKRVTASHFLEHVLAHGIHLCDYLLSADLEMNPLPGFEMSSWDKGYGDFHGVLDHNTLRPIQWLDGTALVLADLFRENGEPVAQSPRAILKKQMERAHHAGLFPMMGSELEFYLFDENIEELETNERHFHEPTPTSNYIIDYHILATTRDENVIRQIRNQMCESRIPIEFSKGEWGKGQHEINLAHADALEMADRHVIYKNGVKEIAWKNSLTVTFMAKYDERAAGSGFHLHTSVYDEKGENNRFWDAQKKQGSTLFRQFLGGLLRYTAPCFLFFAPTVNSYKRFQETSFAPTRIAWSEDNRTTGFRIIGQEGSFRIENRMPGADANPYLAFAATLAAGLVGIEEKLDCGEPYCGNAYLDNSLPQVPRDLLHAAELFEQSEVARNAFGEEVVRHYTRLARMEQKAFNAVVTNWERKRYFDQI